MLHELVMGTSIKLFFQNCFVGLACTKSSIALKSFSVPGQVAFVLQNAN